MRVFISRNLKPDSLFKKALESNGYEVIGRSLLSFKPIDFTFPEEKPDWIFFYSQKAISFFSEPLSQINHTVIIDLKANDSRFKTAVMGKGSSDFHLKTFGRLPDFIGEGHPQKIAEQFLAIANNKRVLFPRALNSQRSIQLMLPDSVNTIDLVVYENNIEVNVELPVCDLVVFTSPLNIAAYQQSGYPVNMTCICIGPTTERAAIDAGFKKVITAKQADELALAEAALSLKF